MLDRLPLRRRGARALASRPPRARLAAVVVAALSLSGGACGGDPAPTAPSLPALEGGIDPLAGAHVRDRTGQGSATGVAHIDRVVVERHEGYDRVVFGFTGDGLPRWEVGYLEPPVRQDGSGNPVAVAGEAVLGVRMQPASTVDLSGDEVVRVYDGPERIPGTGGVVREVVSVSDFEAHSRWAIGLSDRVDFRVLTPGDPPRLVVDVRNH